MSKVKQLGGYQSGQLGRTVNPLINFFAGSNPAPPTNNFVIFTKLFSLFARNKHLISNQAKPNFEISYNFNLKKNKRE